MTDASQTLPQLARIQDGSYPERHGLGRGLRPRNRLGCGSGSVEIDLGLDFAKNSLGLGSDTRRLGGDTATIHLGIHRDAATLRAVDHRSELGSEASLVQLGGNIHLFLNLARGVLELALKIVLTLKLGLDIHVGVGPVNLAL